MKKWDNLILGKRFGTKMSRLIDDNLFGNSIDELNFISSDLTKKFKTTNKKRKLTTTIISSSSSSAASIISNYNNDNHDLIDTYIKIYLFLNVGRE